MTKRTVFPERAWLIFWIAASAAVALLIFLFSSQTAPESDSISRGLLRRLLALLLGRSPDQAMMRRFHHYLRKAAHFSIYALLGFCLSGGFHHQKRLPPVPAAIVLAALYAATDEFHQSFVPGRGPLLTDVLIDASGAALGALVMALLLRLLRRPRET